jgi:hypothetical protein
MSQFTSGTITTTRDRRLRRENKPPEAAAQAKQYINRTLVLTKSYVYPGPHQL